MTTEVTEDNSEDTGDSEGAVSKAYASFKPVVGTYEPAEASLGTAQSEGMSSMGMMDTMSSSVCISTCMTGMHTTNPCSNDVMWTLLLQFHTCSSCRTT